jgi:hypothetical protein
MFGCSWFEAFQVCEQMGGFLVEIDKESKWDLLSSQLSLLSTMTNSGDFVWWTGGHYNSAFQDFYWFFSGNFVHFSDWAQSEPSQFKDVSIYIGKGSDEKHHWFAGPAESRIGHPICEK